MVFGQKKNMSTGFEKWNNWYRNARQQDPGAYKYGETASYVKAAQFLSDVKEVEDWGCGMAGFKNHCTTQYIGIDGSCTPFADKNADLAEYRSSVEGIMMRHVIEHNHEWKKILQNALASFSKKMCLVIFTPFCESTQKIADNKMFGVDVPDISFRKEDITDCLKEYKWKLEVIDINQFYGMEQIFYIEKV